MTSQSGFVAAYVAIILTCKWQVDGRSNCPSFCGQNGLYHEAINCPEPEMYCCGTAFRRECCFNQSQELSDYFQDEYNCWADSWPEIHWQMTMLITVAILLLLVCSAYCVVCFTEKMMASIQQDFLRTTSSMSTTAPDTEGDQYLADISSVTTEEDEASNPNSPYAFSPPAYDSLMLTDLPPKYADIVSVVVDGKANTRHEPETPHSVFSGSCSSTAGGRRK